MSFERAWAACAPLLDRALARGGRTHGLEDVRDMILRGEAQLWRTPRSAVVTLIEADPRERRLLVWLAAGDLAELREAALDAVERFARAHGCRRILLVGRAGWERALRDKGFAPLARVIAKEL
jgi:hypothetical protein